MSKNSEKRLASILDAYDIKREAARHDAERKNTDREVFLEAFAKTSKEIIGPAMQAIGEQLKARGHDFEISEQAESVQTKGHAQNAGITITIFPGGERPSYSGRHNCPHVAVIAQSHNNSAYVHEGTTMPGRGGRAGSAEEYELSQITSEVVQEHILRVLAEAMG